MNQHKNEYDHKKVLGACDLYAEGVFATIALVNETRWDAEKRTINDLVSYQFGRRLTTSPRNRMAPSTEVTPDCISQVNSRLGIIAEAKLSLPRTEEFWDDDIRQLEKYDDDLTGWWTETELLESHEIIALVPLERAVKFADRLEVGIATGHWRFDRQWAVVGFYKKSGEEKDFIALKRERGKLSLEPFNERLRISVLVGFDILITAYSDRKFVDHEPPLPYLLQVIWDDLFTRYAAENRGDNWDRNVEFSVTADQVTSDLQEYYGFRSTGARSPEIPRRRWVRKALDALVDFGMASSEDNWTYKIRYKRTGGDVLKKFGRLLFRREQKRKNKAAKLEKQPALFPELVRND